MDLLFPAVYLPGLFPVPEIPSFPEGLFSWIISGRAHTIHLIPEVAFSAVPAFYPRQTPPPAIAVPNSQKVPRHFLRFRDGYPFVSFCRFRMSTRVPRRPVPSSPTYARFHRLCLAYLHVPQHFRWFQMSPRFPDVPTHSGTRIRMQRMRKPPWDTKARLKISEKAEN